MEEKSINNVSAVSTRDGSSTLWAPDFDEHYHSIHGALTESMHVFIDAGLNQFPDEAGRKLAIFEMGFGTGLNAWLTWIYKGAREISYLSIEKYPLDQSEWHSLNYGELVKDALPHQNFSSLHEAPWNEAFSMDEQFVLEKREADLLTFETDQRFDLIFFDAFAPSSQVELWSESVMRKLFSWCKPGAVFTTYSAKGDVRRALLAAGFDVQKIPGPPGKREMLRGIRPKVDG